MEQWVEHRISDPKVPDSTPYILGHTHFVVSLGRVFDAGVKWVSGWTVLNWISLLAQQGSMLFMKLGWHRSEHVQYPGSIIETVYSQRARLRRLS